MVVPVAVDVPVALAVVVAVQVDVSVLVVVEEDDCSADSASASGSVQRGRMARQRRKPSWAPAITLMHTPVGNSHNLYMEMELHL